MVTNNNWSVITISLDATTSSYRSYSPQSRWLSSLSSRSRRGSPRRYAWSKGGGGGGGGGEARMDVGHKGPKSVGRRSLNSDDKDPRAPALVARRNIVKTPPWNTARPSGPRDSVAPGSVQEIIVDCVRSEAIVCLPRGARLTARWRRGGGREGRSRLDTRFLAFYWLTQERGSETGSLVLVLTSALPDAAWTMADTTCRD